MSTGRQADDVTPLFTIRCHCGGHVTVPVARDALFHSDPPCARFIDCDEDPGAYLQSLRTLREGSS